MFKIMLSCGMITHCNHTYIFTFMFLSIFYRLLLKYFILIQNVRSGPFLHTGTTHQHRAPITRWALVRNPVCTPRTESERGPEQDRVPRPPRDCVGPPSCLEWPCLRSYSYLTHCRIHSSFRTHPIMNIIIIFF